MANLQNSSDPHSKKITDFPFVSVSYWVLLLNLLPSIEQGSQLFAILQQNELIFEVAVCLQ